MATLDIVQHTSACPLDCPDACSLDVTVEAGRVVEARRQSRNPVTDGYICGKVRHFPERSTVLTGCSIRPSASGRKGSGQFRRVSWDEALRLVVERLSGDSRPVRRRGDPAL